VSELEYKLKDIFRDAKNVEVRIHNNEIEIAIYDLPFVKTYLNMFFRDAKVATTMVKRDSGNAMLYINILFKTNVSEVTINKILPVIQAYYRVISNVDNY
jgi:hypothetical protein